MPRFASIALFTIVIVCCQTSVLYGDEATSPTVPRWHPIELSFLGPETSELASPNPFTDFRLVVTFRNGSHEKRIRGFFAADGDAANTSANAGRVWKVRFAPDQLGTWSYEAELRHGEDVALSGSDESGDRVDGLSGASGSFVVVEGDEGSDDFRDRGFLVARQGYYRFSHNGQPWLKGGCDSPENMLAFEDFDSTFRLKSGARQGEASVDEEIHSYASHRNDWREGDPTWADGKGKALIGGINYLADQGVNSMYFLTMNIGGDGNDVWPYNSPSDLTRFDCSKLDQWNIVFDHMQHRGIALHLVTQETENERMLDDGETGRLRQLYYQELIARFANHPALIWNLGEENGPADFSPDGQTNQQQRSMASYLDKHDPYNHPIVLHTHSTADGKEHILPGLLGHVPLDGLSFQVDQPARVHDEIIQWKRKSKTAGHRWLIGMDEIGKWDVGVVPDSVDPNHDTLRKEVLWGSLMAGAAGVEWYFGAKQPHNDLTCEDWRQRENMWKQTTIARRFFENYLPFTQMNPADELTSSAADYCLAIVDDTYAIYLPAGETTAVQLSDQVFGVKWFDPTKGGDLQSGSASTIRGPGAVDLGQPPSNDKRDWVVLLRRR